MKILRIDAFSAIAFALENNRIDEVNQMLNIVSKSIGRDKEKNTFSVYIEISNKEAQLFQKAMPNIDIYTNKEQEN